MFLLFNCRHRHLKVIVLIEQVSKLGPRDFHEGKNQPKVLVHQLPVLGLKLFPFAYKKLDDTRNSQ